MAREQQSQIKHCVVQFTEILGFEQLPEQLEPEEYATTIQDIAAIYDETVRLYDGHVDKHEGKIFMATYGVPHAHEEDPERAIKSALLFRNKLNHYRAQKSYDLNPRIGINLGKVYAGDVGSSIKREYTVMGDAVNVAARIMEHAPAGSILVSAEIQQIAKPAFIFSEGHAFRPQGFKQPINVFQVTDQKTGFVRRRGIEGLKSPLIGRSAEMDELKKYIDNTSDGKRSIVVLLGEAGVGKSRLVEELFTYSLATALEQAKIINWYSGYCSPYKETIYLPFIDIIRQICNIESADSEKAVTEKLLAGVNALAKQKADCIYPYLANLFNIKIGTEHEEKLKYLEPQAIKLQTHTAIATMLNAHAATRPCIYVIDDLYLADMPTLEALQFFLESEDKTPVLVFLISRPDREKPFWGLKEMLKEKAGCEEIVLQRLDRKSTREISENLLKIPRLPAELVNDMIVKSDGNPFFLEEIIKLLIARQILYHRGGEWLATSSEVSFSIPYTIESIIRARFDTMSDVVKKTLEEMAIIGRNFSQKILRIFTAQWEALEEIISQVEDLGFITSSSGQDFSFNHALVREVIYSGIPEKRKKMLHLKAAQAIEGLYKDRLPEFYDILFEHYRNADEYEKTVHYGSLAGDNAEKRYANNEAIHFYDSVLSALEKLSSDPEQEREVLIKLGAIKSRIGQNEEAFESYHRALRLCKNDKQKAHIHNLIADTYQSISEYPKSLEHYTMALDRLRAGSDIDRANVQHGIAWVHYLQGDISTAQQILEQVLPSLAGAPTIQARRILSRVYNVLAAILAYTGDREKSFEYYNKSLKLYEILDDIAGQSVVYNNICGYFTDQGDHYSALSYLEKSLHLAEKTGNLLSQAITTFNIGETLFQLGDLEKAEENYMKYLTINAQIHNRLGNGYGNWGLGLLYLERDDLARARDLFCKARTIFKELGSLVMELHVMLSIVELHRQEGDFKRAWEVCDEISKSSQQTRAQDILLAAKIAQAALRFDQAERHRDLATSYLKQAKKLLDEVLDEIRERKISIETQFNIYFHLSRINRELGKSEESVKFLKQAQREYTTMIGYVRDDEARRKFADRKMFKEFASYRQGIET